MILLLVITVWIVVLALVAGLCATARVGDLQLRRRSGEAGSGGSQSPIVEPAEYLGAAPYATVPSVRSADAEVLVRSGSLAA